MSAFAPQLVRALATGAAVETGREVARRNNILGFLQWDDDADSGPDFYPYESGGGNDWGGYFFDDFGNYYEYDWFNAGGPSDYYQGLDYGFYQVDTGEDFNVYYLDQYANQFAPGNTPGPMTGSGWSWDWALDLVNSWFTPPFGGAPTYAQAVEATTGYPPCDGIWQGVMRNGVSTVECVPPPPPRSTQPKKNSPIKTAAQKAAAQARNAQKKQDSRCQKDPQGRPVWFNPQSGKCELVPPCAPGLKFDSALRRCLTPQEIKDIYGDNSWIWWALGIGLVVVASGRRK